MSRLVFSSYAGARRCTIVIVMLSALLLCSCRKAAETPHWVGTWATAQQLVEPHNCPPMPGLAGNTLRQIVQTSIAGQRVRLKLSNEYGAEPLEIRGVTMALAATAGSSPDIDASSVVALTFDGSPSLTIPAGGRAVSDVITFDLAPRTNVAIDIRYGSASSTSVSGHPGSRTTSWLLADGDTDWTHAVATNHWYTIDALEVDAPDGSAVVVLGNSITDGRGSTTNQQDRWTDNLSRRLLANPATSRMAVLNMGLGGNCVLSGGLATPAVRRYARDLFGQEGVSHIILFEGVNDLGSSADGPDTARRIIALWEQIIGEAHERGIRVIAATITPFHGNGYYTPDHEAGRQIVNDWVRSSALLDGVIDFDRAVRNPADTITLDSIYLYENDFLHPNAHGYQVMADAVELSLFER